MEILLNGYTTNVFKGSRGIRQGDPLSPYLFSYCVWRSLVDTIRIRGTKVKFSHLMFANDIILLIKTT